MEKLSLQARQYLAQGSSGSSIRPVSLAWGMGVVGSLRRVVVLWGGPEYSLSLGAREMAL